MRYLLPTKAQGRNTTGLVAACRNSHPFRHPSGGWPRSPQQHRPTHRQFHLTNFVRYNVTDRLRTIQTRHPHLQGIQAGPHGAINRKRNPFGIGDVSTNRKNLSLPEAFHKGYTSLGMSSAESNSPPGTPAISKRRCRSENGLTPSGSAAPRLATRLRFLRRRSRTDVYESGKRLFIQRGFKYGPEPEGRFRPSH